jgi:midasin (ATPase involved in ribosome maturation)
LERWGGKEGLPLDILGHFRWLLQKRQLKQDVYLAGPPTSTRRQMVLALAELCGLEVEYLAITRDTAESDLKQRREIVGDSVLWSDAAPVRAAIHGRLLILDGLENAERNVLPTLNNLLENREMMLEDGRFLMRAEAVQHLVEAEAEAGTGAGVGAEAGVGASASSSARLVAVHPDFQVIALGLPVPPYQGRPLDPPLRSRFQSRFVEELQLEDALGCVDAGGVGSQQVGVLITQNTSFYRPLVPNLVFLPRTHIR